MILIKLTSRSRPDKFFRALDNININARTEDWKIIATLDKDDTTMFHSDIVEKMDSYPKLEYYWGHSKNKIDAINRDMDKGGEWDILINLSDDQIFTEEGFDEIIMNDMAKYFPDGDGFLHYNDGNQRDNVPTMSIMGRKYYERFHYIYNPSYESVWCDVESKLVAQYLERWVYIDRVIFKHLHPAWHLAEWDAQYKKTEAPDVWMRDETNFNLRKAKNFYLSTK
jgi:hypothetical protein